MPQETKSHPFSAESDNVALGVVHDTDQLPATVFDIDENCGRAGVDCVFDQLFDDSRRPLDHLARGDAVDQRGRELMNATKVTDRRRRLHAADYRGWGAKAEMASEF